MKNKMLTGWTFQRTLLLVVGMLIIGQSVSIQQWLGVGLGVYVSFMALFSLGCASSNCRRREL